MSDQDSPFKQDVKLDKAGIVGARWWHQGLVDEDAKVSRRQAMINIALATGAVAAVAGLAASMASVFDSPEPTSIGTRDALVMQRVYGWDFGARGAPLVFNGKAEGPFVRGELTRLYEIMTPKTGPFAKYHVPTLLESIGAAPSAALPDPQDGRPRPDAGQFQRLYDVIVPIHTPEMDAAYAAGEALARLAHAQPALAVAVDLPGPESVAFAAGAATLFEPILLLDNWPHPHAVVPSHLALAALAYYQPRFASQNRKSPPPLFVLDRNRLNPYSEQSDRFDNRYYARMPKLSALSKDGIETLLYVVASPAALPEPDDLNPIFAVPKSEANVNVRAVTLADFQADRNTFWFPTHAPEPGSQPLSAAVNHRFLLRALAPPPSFAKVPVVITASGLIVAGALDRSGSMNRFSGGWSG